MTPEQSAAMTRFHDASACLVELADVDTLGGVFDLVGNAIGYATETVAPGLRHLRRLRSKHSHTEAVQRAMNSPRALAEAMVVASTASALAGFLKALGPDLYRWNPEIEAMCLPSVSEGAIRPLNAVSASVQAAAAMCAAIRSFSDTDTTWDFGGWCRPAVRNPRALALVCESFVPRAVTFAGTVSAPDGLYRWFNKIGFEDDEVFAPVAVLLALKAIKFPGLVRPRDVAALVPLVMAVRVEAEQRAVDDPTFDINPLVAGVGQRLAKSAAAMGFTQDFS